MPSEQPKVDDGGPAFPRPTVGTDQAGMVDCGAQGMSRRDYFAGQALANSAICHSGMTPKERAEEAYRNADEMLKAGQT